MTINLLPWKVPLPGVYAELAHAPMWGAFFVLAMLIIGMLIDRRLVAWGRIASRTCSSLIQRAIRNRRWLYGSFLIVTASGYWLFYVPPTTLSDYPPRRTPSVKLLTRELALAPGSQFRGRLMTVVPANLQGPATVDYFYEIVSNRYRRYLGNDYWIDPSAFNIPTLKRISLLYFAHHRSPSLASSSARRATVLAGPRFCSPASICASRASWA